MTTPDVPVFVITRQFAASPERVYDAWADPTKMAQWSGPKGSSVEIVHGSQVVGQTTISRTASPAGPEMRTGFPNFCSEGDGMDASHPLIDAAIEREGREDS